MGLILAIGWLLDGFASIAHAVTASGVSGLRRVAVALAGVVLVIGGIIVAAFPQTSIALLIRWSAILLLIVGIAEIVGALLQRRRDSRAGAAA